MNYNVWAEPTHRSFLRKAGSDFGWDWGPAFLTVGLAGRVYLSLEYRPRIKLRGIHFLQEHHRTPSTTQVNLVEITTIAEVEFQHLNGNETAQLNVFLDEKRMVSWSGSIVISPDANYSVIELPK